MPGERLTVLRAIDKFDRLGADGVHALLGNGRKDDSGDFTKGAGLLEPMPSISSSDCIQVAVWSQATARVHAQDDQQQSN